MSTKEMVGLRAMTVEGVCCECGVNMTVKMMPEHYEEYLKYDGELMCFDCVISDPELSEKRRMELLEGPKTYSVITCRYEEKENYIGEQPLDYQSYLSSSWWKDRREKALDLAKHRCQLCNSPEDLQVHHRTYERIGAELPEDLTVLCKPCHYWFHKSRHKF
ncbi:MAG: hypothetical protein M0P69_21395 [Bacteroidales bacterium]|jgi:hypothetical protein|nr:hypothetical protein [Bacteroidales bacterium]